MRWIVYQYAYSLGDASLVPVCGVGQECDGRARFPGFVIWTVSSRLPSATRMTEST